MLTWVCLVLFAIVPSSLSCRCNRETSSSGGQCKTEYKVKFLSQTKLWHRDRGKSALLKIVFHQGRHWCYVDPGQGCQDERRGTSSDRWLWLDLDFADQTDLVLGFGRTRPVKIHQTIMGTLAQESIWKDRIQSFSNQLHDQIVMCRSNLSPSSLPWQWWGRKSKLYFIQFKSVSTFTYSLIYFF